MTHYTLRLMEAANAVFRHAGSNALSAFLMTALFGAIAWLFIIWKEPFAEIPSADRPYARPVSAVAANAPAKALVQRASSERDIFRPVVPKKIEKPKKVKKALPPPPPAPIKPPPPRLALVGTIILDDREAAIIDYAGSGQKATYRVGDAIEGFVIREIRKDWVLLDREGEAMRVFMAQPSGAGRAQAPGYPPGNDIPARLVPRPKGGAGEKVPD